MNLALLFEPLPDLPDAEVVDAGTVGAHLLAFRPDMPPPDWANAHIALLGIPDGRDAFTADLPADHLSAADTRGINAIRERFYGLSVGTGAWRVVDMGNLRPGPTPEDTHERLAEVVDWLLRQQVMPVILGGSHALTLGQHAGYEYQSVAAAVRACVVDRAFDVAENAALNQRWLRQLLLREPNHLLTLSHLASQRYLVRAAEAAALEKMYFDMIRLGQLHTSLRDAEPLLRAADWLSIDLSACAHTAVPGAAQPASPFGLSAEQLCQLTWYAGLSRQLTSAGFYGYRADHDPLGLGATTVATAVWYLVEGYYHRPAHGPEAETAAYARYDVTLAGSGETLTFYQHHQTEQWWLLVEPPAATPHLLPCAEEDYLTAARGDIPHRWVLALARC